MNTLHLTCPHCKNLMAVSVTLLGKNVRCPHCRQVVQTPAPVAEPVPPEAQPVVAAAIPQTLPTPELDSLDEDLTFQMPEAPKESHDSIFGEAVDEDVFGSRPIKPEVPPHEDPDAPTEQVPMNPLPREERLESDFGVTNTVMTLPDPPAPASIPRPVFEPLPETTPAPAPPQKQPSSESDFSAVSSQRAIKKPTVPTSRGSNLFTWLLLLWALAATGAAVYFATTKSYLHPFQAIPDVFGEYDKADRKKVSNNLLPSDREDVPLDLRVPLGANLVMNQLEIHPLKIEAGSFDYFVQRGKAPATKGRERQSCFVLRLRLKNLSNDLVFHPVDPAFNRKKENDDTGRLYNRLNVGTAVYPGGLFPWRPKDSGGVRDYLEGQENDAVPLKPGETREYVIPSQQVSRLSESIRAQGQANSLWRVQLRTGVVSVPPREVAVTSVVGIEFKATEIK